MGCGDRIHQAVPDASFAPAVEAVVNGGWRPIALRQVRPERTRAQHPEDAVENPPIIDPWHAPRLVRQVRLDRLPLPLRQFVAAHPKAPEKELESHRAAQENPQWPIMGFRPSSNSSVGELLINTAIQTQTDLIVMGGYGHSRLREWLLGGVTQSLLFGSPIPVLISH